MPLILNHLPPLHWAIAGAGIAAVTLCLLFLANRRLGISTSLEDLCSLLIAQPYFQRGAVTSGRKWRVPFVIGLVLGGFLSAGTSVGERLVRWERSGDRVSLRSISVEAVADDSLPIALSVASNNVGAILNTFPVQAYGRAGSRDSSTYVIDVSEFFGGDTPTLSGLSAAQRRTYQVRRLDPARAGFPRAAAGAGPGRAQALRGVAAAEEAGRDDPRLTAGPDPYHPRGGRQPLRVAPRAG